MKDEELNVQQEKASQPNVEDSPGARHQFLATFGLGCAFFQPLGLVHLNSGSQGAL